MLKLSHLMMLTVGTLMGAAFVHADPNLQALLENSKDITIENAREYHVTKSFSKLLSESMLTEYSPSGDPTYTKKMINNECKVIRREMGLKECILSISSQSYTNVDGREHGIGNGGGSIDFVYKVRTTPRRMGGADRSIVSNTVRIEMGN